MFSFAKLLPLLLAGLWASPAIAEPEARPVPRTAAFDKTFCIHQNHASSVVALPDGGFAAAGDTNAKGAGRWNAWVIRLDAAGAVLWEKTYGGQLGDVASSIAALPDGGFIVAGSFHSMDMKKGDGWLLRLDAKGEVLWEKTYGGKLAAFASVVALADGGFVVAGKLHEKPVSARKSTAWILRLDASGNILWEQFFRGQETASASAAVQLSDGSFAVAANMHSSHSDEADPHIIHLGAGGTILSDQVYHGLARGTPQSIAALPGGGFAVAGWTDSWRAPWRTWLLRFGPDDELIWQIEFGSAKGDRAMSISPTADDGLIVAGSLASKGNELIVTGSLAARAPSKGTGGTDGWLIRLDRNGEVLWAKTYDKTFDGNDSLQSVETLPNGGFIAAGVTNSKGPDGSHAWIVRLDATGGTQWEKTTFGPKDEHTPPRDSFNYSEGNAVAALPDGGLIAAGFAIGKDAENACVARFDASGTVVWEKTYGGAVTSQAHSVVALPDGGFAVAGRRHANREDAWIFRLDAEGALLWERTFGGTFANNAALMPGGGLAVAGAAGRREEPGGPPMGGNGWIVRLSSSGNLIWERLVGESGMVLTSVAALPDGGIIAAGVNVDTPIHQEWLFRFDADGKLLGEKIIAAGESRQARTIATLPDGGFAIAGSLAPENGTSAPKAWAARFDADMNLLWDKTYAAKGWGGTITALPDDGFAVAGITNPGIFGINAWVARLEASGDLIWEETYGGWDVRWVSSIAVTPDGSLAVGGTTSPDDYGQRQAWIFTVPVERQRPNAR